MAERQAVLGELLLQLRSGRAPLDAGGPRHRIDLEHTVHRLHVDGHHAVEALDPAGLETPDHARAPAEGDDRGIGALAPLEHGLELALVAGVRDGVGRVVEASAEGAHHVAVGLAVGV